MRSSAGPFPLQGLKGYGDVFGANTEKSTYAYHDDLGVPVLAQEDFTDVADFLIVWVVHVHPDHFVGAPLIRGLLGNELACSGVGLHCGRNNKQCCSRSADRGACN